MLPGMSMSLPSSRNSAWARVQWVACIGCTGMGGEHHELSSPAPRAPQSKACCKLPAKPCPNHAAHVKRIVAPHHCARKARAENRANLSHFRVAAACAPSEPSLMGPREARASPAPPRASIAQALCKSRKNAGPTLHHPKTGPNEASHGPRGTAHEPRESHKQTAREPCANAAGTPRAARARPARAPHSPARGPRRPARALRRPRARLAQAAGNLRRALRNPAKSARTQGPMRSPREPSASAARAPRGPCRSARESFGGPADPGREAAPI